jgi:hypothetical protein
LLILLQEEEEEPPRALVLGVVAHAAPIIGGGSTPIVGCPAVTDGAGTVPLPVVVGVVSHHPRALVLGVVAHAALSLRGGTTPIVGTPAVSASAGTVPLPVEVVVEVGVVSHHPRVLVLGVVAHAALSLRGGTTPIVGTPAVSDSAGTVPLPVEVVSEEEP